MWYKYQVHFLADTGEDTENVEDRHREGVVDVIVDKRLDGGGCLDGDDVDVQTFIDIAREIGTSRGYTAVQVLKVSSPPEIVEGYGEENVSVE